MAPLKPAKLSLTPPFIFHIFDTVDLAMLRSEDPSTLPNAVEVEAT
jgi:hypothetical protein